MYKKNFQFFFFAIFDINAEDNLGKDIFVEKRCITCHVIGRGTFVGPDLYNIFDKYSDEEILSWIINPQSIYEQYSKMPINKGYPPMPNLGVNLSEAKELLSYIRNTKDNTKRNSKVLIKGRINNFNADKFKNNQVKNSVKDVVYSEGNIETKLFIPEEFTRLQKLLNPKLDNPKPKDAKPAKTVIIFRCRLGVANQAITTAINGFAIAVP